MMQIRRTINTALTYARTTGQEVIARLNTIYDGRSWADRNLPAVMDFREGAGNAAVSNSADVGTTLSPAMAEHADRSPRSMPPMDAEGNGSAANAKPGAQPHLITTA